MRTPARTKIVVGVAAAVLVIVVAVAAWFVAAPRLSSNSGEEGSESVARTPLEPGKTVADFFPDKTLAECIANVLGVSASDELAVEDCAAITDLTFPALTDANGQPYDFSDVQSIEGIQLFSGLSNLDLSGFISLASADQLGDLGNLQHLNLDGTSVSDVSFLSSLDKLSQVALPATASDVRPLAQCPALQSASIGCSTADIACFDGRGVQLVVPGDFNRDVAYASAQSGNTVTVQNADGSLDIYQPADGQVDVMHM